MTDSASSLLSSLPPTVLDVIFGIAVVSCVVAQFFILRAVWRVVPSITGSPEVPAPRRAPEIAWALLPAVLMVALFVGAWRALHPVISPAIMNPTVTPGAKPSANSESTSRSAEFRV